MAQSAGFHSYLDFDKDGQKYQLRVSSYSVSSETKQFPSILDRGPGPSVILSQELQLEIAPYDINMPYLNPGDILNFMGEYWIVSSTEINVSQDNFINLSVIAKQGYQKDIISGKPDTYLSSGIDDVLPDDPNMIGGGLNNYMEKQKYEEKKEKLNEILKNFDFSKRKDKKGES